ncbi:hypothetical protein HK102_007002, partial [Quaeritorhiza haematococci]
VDYSPEYDDLNRTTADAEDQYFDSEEPSEERGRRRVSGRGDTDDDDWMNEDDEGW